jgi:hypothetical protein
LTERISYWLVPAEPDRQQLGQVIRELARRTDAPVFDPHVTLYSGPASSLKHASAIVRSVTRDVAALSLRTTGISHSEQFTKTLFIECETHPAIAAMSEAFKQQSEPSLDYELKPHVSLLYANVPERVRQKLAGELLMPPAIRFDCVRAVLTGTQTKTRQDVEAWRAIAEVRLEA